MGDPHKQEPKWFKEFRKEFNGIMNEFQEKIDNLNRKLDLITEVKNIALQNQTNIVTLTEKNDSLQKEVAAMKHKVLQLETQSKKENLIFTGIAESKSKETWKDCETKIIDILTKNLEITNDIKFEKVYRMGPYTPGRMRPIIAKFSFYKDRENVWAKRTKLKGSKIWISEDYPTEIAEARRQLYPILRHALDLKNTKDYKGGIKTVSLNLDKLVLNRRPYSVKEIHQLPSELKPENIASRTEGEVTVFFSRKSVFSNFYMNAPFTLDGDKYNCSEQYYQNAKAKFFEDDDISFQIMHTKDPYKQAELGRKVKNFNEHAWMNQGKAKDVLTKAITAKFTQNEQAREALRRTGKNVIGEATRNKVWGIGLALDDVKATTRDYWDGQNICGDVLGYVRDTVLVN